LPLSQQRDVRRRLRRLASSARQRYAGHTQNVFHGDVDGAAGRADPGGRWRYARLNTLEHQPAKIAAIEGHWENKPGEATPLLLFGVPDMDEERTKYGLEIPALGSLILTHSLNKQVPALKDFPPRIGQTPLSSSGLSASWSAWAC
jgi:hypothetical protein